MIRFDPKHACPICGGHAHMPQGKGIRCWGFTTDEGDFAHCSREEHAGNLQRSAKDNTFIHWLKGPCRCGEQHNDAMTQPDADVRNLGSARRASIDQTYDYTDADGNLLYQVVRMKPKDFRQRRPNENETAPNGSWIWGLGNTTPTIYRLPEVMSAIAAGDHVYIVEGEKDAERLRALDQVATCNSGGAGKWRDEFAAFFRGAEDVRIVQDRDDVGREHARRIATQLAEVAKHVRIYEARDGKDVSDHLDAGHALDALRVVWPEEELLCTDPVAWKRSVVRASVDVTDPLTEIEPDETQPMAPRWPTGLSGEESCRRLPNMRGVTILTGRPSAGKSYLAVASACAAARSGWDVLYVSSEMSRGVLLERVRRHVGIGNEIPEELRLFDVFFGAELPLLVELVASNVTRAPMLVVMDSVSSFIDQTLTISERDVYKLGPLKQLVMWAINVRRTTNGDISFLMLSEANASGETKGRGADHKADLVLNMRSDESEPGIKHLSIVKAWEYQTGPVGDFVIDYERASVIATRIEP